MDPTKINPQAQTQSPTQSATDTTLNQAASQITPPIAQQVTSQTVNPLTSNKRLIIMVLVLIIMVAILVGVGYYLFTISQNKMVPTVKPVVVQPNPNQTIDQDLNAITVSDSSSDFATIDQDLNSL